VGQGTLAIDLGNASTLLGWQAGAGEEARLLALEPLSCTDAGGTPWIPSLVLCGAGSPLVGAQVLEAGAVENCQRHFKAELALEQPAAPALLAAETLLQAIWDHLPSQITPERLVLTAPVHGYAPYRRWLENWASALPVAEVSLVDEPTAAALGAGMAPGSLLLVVDVGAGTTDVSLVRLEGGEGKALPMAQLLRFAGRAIPQSRSPAPIARVLGKAGASIGGRAIDHWWAEALGSPLPPPAAWLQAAEQLKCALSSAANAEVMLDYQGKAQLLRGRRRQLEAVLEDRGLAELLEDLFCQVEAAARRAGTNLEEVDGVLAVGGGSALPWLQRWLQLRLPKQSLPVAQPMAAVVRGALAMTPALRVIDVLQQGVSLRCWDQRLAEQRWHPLFLAGQAWPTPQPLELVLACRSDQTSVELQLGTPQANSHSEVVFRDGIPSLRRLSNVVATVLPWPGKAAEIPLSAPVEAGKDRLKLRFWVDDQRQLRLEAEDLQLGRSLAGQVLGILE
jgi:molecular chaperone DnaK (HSP70)